MNLKDYKFVSWDGLDRPIRLCKSNRDFIMNGIDNARCKLNEINIIVGFTTGLYEAETYYFYRDDYQHFFGRLESTNRLWNWLTQWENYAR